MPATVSSPIRALLLALALLASGETAARASDDARRIEAVTAYEGGRYEDALAALDDGPLAPDLAYLRIRTLAALERYADALEASAEPRSAWPEAVRRDLLERRVSWAASAGRCDLVRAETPSESRAAIRLRGRCAFASGAFDEAIALLEPAKDAEGSAMYIRALIEKGEREAARPLARAYYVAHPASPDAARFRSFLEEQGPLVLTVEEHLARAAAWLRARRPEAAFDELKTARPGNDKRLAARLWHLRGDALFRTRKRYPEAERAFARAVRYRGETEDYDAFHAIRAASRAGDDESAIKRYKQFARRYPKSKLVPDALFLSAWLGVREKRRTASRELERFVESKHAAQAPALRRAALWQLGFHAFEKRAARQAKKWLEAYGAAATSPLERARAAYWQGRTALLARDKGEARAHLSRALREERLGYYAQLAARRLRALGDEPLAFDANPPSLPRPPPPELPPEVAFYRGIGLHPDAADAVLRSLRSETDPLRRISALLEAGEPTRLNAAAEPLADRVLAGPPDADRAWIWSALLPRPYASRVEQETASRALDPSLLYGHMQVESRYRPRAISGADAMGLLQLLPQTAKGVAKGLGLEVERRDLLRPAMNIRLGAAYLGNLVSRYRRQFPLAIAAYNAGTHKVDEWLRRAKEHELDRWVESIPVDQTRNYVRRVIAGWSRYHAQLHPAEPWDLPLPERVSFPTR